MEEEDLILLAQEQARQTQPILLTLKSIEAKQYTKTNRSVKQTIDLTKSHTEEPLGLEASSITYLWLTIEKADSAFTYKLKQVNQQKSGIFTAVEGASLEQHEFTEIFITNTAASGEAIIQVGWRE